MEFDGLIFNNYITERIKTQLGKYNLDYLDLETEVVSTKVPRDVFMASVAELNGFSYYPLINSIYKKDIALKCSVKQMATHKFLPLYIEEDLHGAKSLLIAITNPWDLEVDSYVSSRFDYPIKKIVTTVTEIDSVLEDISNLELPTEEVLSAVEVENNDEIISEFDVTGTHDNNVDKLIAYILSVAVRDKASDIHFKVEKDYFYYSMRVNGDIGAKEKILYKLKDRIDARFMILVNQPTEIRNTMPGISGRFTISYQERPIDIRYERHRTYRGFHITLRLLDKAHLNITLGKGNLAFDKNTMLALKKVMNIPSGIIVMSGPTGSGKSTTLNAILRELNTPDVNILTLENPVEDEIPGVTHCDLKNSSEFEPMITSFMRSDPDIILMGEVRDIASAELAIEAAVTGHKVLTTIHTPKASQIIERFEQLGLERWKIAQTLKAACAQRLLKILCNECKVLKKGLSDDEIELFSLDSKFKTMDVYEASKVGCRECGHCGDGGRAAILEIIPITPQLGDALSKGTITPYEVELQIAKEGKLPNLRKTGLEYFERGLTDLDSLKKVIDLSH